MQTYTSYGSTGCHLGAVVCSGFLDTSMFVLSLQIVLLTKRNQDEKGCLAIRYQKSVLQDVIVFLESSWRPPEPDLPFTVQDQLCTL